MSVKLSDLQNLYNPSANTIVLATDDQINANASYQLKLSTLRNFVTYYSYGQANNAFNKANSAYDYALSVREFSDGVVFYFANGAYDRANSAYYNAELAKTIANTANLHSFAGYDKANLAYSIADSAYNAGVITNGIATTANNTGISAYRHSNASFEKANSAYAHANNAYESSNTNYWLAFEANTNSYVALGLSTVAEATASQALTTAESAYDAANSAIEILANTVIDSAYILAQINTSSTNILDYINLNSANASIVFELSNTVNLTTNTVLQLASTIETNTQIALTEAMSAYAHANSAFDTANIALVLTGNGGTSNVDMQMVYSYVDSQKLHATNTVSSNLVISSSNDNQLIPVINGSNITIPSVGLSNNFSAIIVQYDSNPVNILSQPGVVLHSSTGKYKTTYQYDSIGIVKLADGSYLLSSSEAKSDISTLGDVTLTVLNEGDILSYSTSQNKWVNIPYTTSSGGTSNVVNVKYEGVVGNGLVDDTIAMQNVINSYPNRTIYIPPGTYACNSLNLLSNTTIVGSGSSSVFNASSNNINLFIYDGAISNGEEIKIENISISSNNKTGCNAVYIKGNTSYTNLCSKITIRNSEFVGSFTNGISINYTEKSKIEDNLFTGCTTDILLRNSYRNRIINNNLLGTTSSVVENTSSNFNIISGNMSKIAPSTTGANSLSVNNITNASI